MVVHADVQVLQVGEKGGRGKVKKRSGKRGKRYGKKGGKMGRGEERY